MLVHFGKGNILRGILTILVVGRPILAGVFWSYHHGDGVWWWVMVSGRLVLVVGDGEWRTVVSGGSGMVPVEVIVMMVGGGGRGWVMVVVGG